jgi:hypothetical protein
MKKKIIFIPVLLIMFLFIFSVQPVIAADVFATVSIDRVGPNGATVGGRFTEVNGVFTNIFFSFDSTISNQLLATALTAVSLQKNVVIQFNDANNKIFLMFVDK